MSGDHLRRDLVGAVLAVKRVKDHEAVVAGDVGRGPDRIQYGQIGLRDETQQPRSLGSGDGRRRQRDGGGGQESAASHRAESLAVRAPVSTSRYRQRGETGTVTAPPTG